MNRSLYLTVVGLGLAGAVPGCASAQEVRPVTVRGVASGEVPANSRWVYPRGERVDPAIPPDALYSGEGFPHLQVSVIMFEPAKRNGSRALVLMDGSDPLRKVVREGDVIGQYRIFRIERDRVVVRIRSLGSVREEVLLPLGAASSDRR